MVAVAIESSKSVRGVSLKMMECYIVVFFCRLTAIVPFEGYLPFDKSGDWLYQVCEAFCLCLAAAIALVMHPHLNNNLPSDISWAFALYLESVTVLPQLFMFMKEARAQPHTAHFLAAQATSRLMSA